MMSNEWKKGVIEDIAKVSSGGTPSRQNDSYWFDGQIPWVTTTEVQFGVINDTEQKITEAGLKNSSAKLFPKDTILMAMYGQGKTRGQVAKLGIEASTNQACAALLLKDGFEVDYYYQYLVSQYENIRELANSGGQQNLSAGIIKGIHVPIPPQLEQRKIAKVLSTWDKAISTTERLIDNSKQQKKALMQQLLTGKKRLLDDSGKPFDGEWKYVRAGDMFSTRSNKKHDSDLPILAITQDQGAIPREFIDYNVSVTKESISGYKVVEIGDFIISLRSFQGGIEYSRYKGICSPAYVILYPKVEIVDAFYKYHLKSHIFIQAMKSRLEGIRDGKIISYKYFSEIKLPKPSSEEQQKIASVLTNADKEIELLEQQLAELKQEKRALMQQLLTGKRRVKI